MSPVPNQPDPNEGLKLLRQYLIDRGFNCEPIYGLDSHFFTPAFHMHGSSGGSVTISNPKDTMILMVFSFRYGKSIDSGVNPDAIELFDLCNPACFDEIVKAALTSMQLYNYKGEAND